MARGLKGRSRHILLFAIACALMLGSLTEVRAAVYEVVSGTFWSGTGSYASKTKVVGGDVNGDGYGDVIQFCSRSKTSSRVYVLKSNGASMVKSTAWTGTMEFAKTQIAAGDHDGDGYTDLFLLRDRGRNTCSVYVMLSNGTTLILPKELHRTGTGSMAFSRARLAVSDANRDGKDEAVIFYESGGGRAKVLVLGRASIQGIVRSATGGDAMSGVDVSLYSGAAVIGQTNTVTDGSFTMAAWGGSTQKVVFSAPGYVPADYWGINPNTIGTTALETVRMVPSEPSSPGSVSGFLRNAFNGDLLSGASIRLRPGVNNRTGTLTSYSATTNSGGAYTFASIPRGLYTAQVSKSGYTTTYFTVICVGGQANPEQNMSLSPRMTGSDSSDIRAVLTWGSEPSDLDSHLTGPVSDSERFHVYFAGSNRKYPATSSSPYAILDTDDTTSFGPETITISRTSGGAYRYSVHDYSHKSSTYSTALATSGARVDVYRGSSLIGTYYVPSGPGTLWTVFEVRDSNFTPINSMGYEDMASEVQ